MASASTDSLQQMAVFGGLLADTLQCLLTSAPRIKRPAGEPFFHHGEEGDSFFVLLQGRALAVLPSPDFSYLLRSIAVGDSFGEAANVDLQPRSNTVIAQSPCEAIEIGPDVLHQVWQHDLEQFTLLHMNMSRELSRRLRDSDDRRLEHWQSVTNAQ